MAYLNLAVEITAPPDAAGKYRIALQSPVGEASAEAVNPFTPEELANFLQILSREKPVSRATEANTARDFGARLFNFVFQSSPEISNAYFGSLREAANSDGLRIRLTVDGAGALSGIPWEYLRDPANDFLALSRRTPIVRYTQQLDTHAAAAITMPLRVLVMISAPANFPTLDVEGEWTRLQEATASLRERGLLQLERLESATLIALQRRLRAEDFHVFHFVGHSDYDAKSQQGFLVFEDETERSKGQIISGQALSRELAEENTGRLVVLNSCHSANRPSADALTGISSSLVTRGIPAVVAMQFAITDGAAKAFAEEFYRALSELLPLDAAVSEGRRAISNRVGNNEWATPVLYMRSDSGVLFTSMMKPVAVERTFSRWMAWGALGVIVLVLLFLVASPVIFPPAPMLTPTPTVLPDLQIGRVRVSPSNPAPGQIFILSISITNAGAAPSGPFNWSWDASQSSPVLLNSLDGHIDNIPPGASKNISFPFSYGWWGTYISRLQVDAETQVVESDERNNSKPFDVQTSLQPFEVDFSLLPTNELVDPPLTLAANTFDAWNVQFSLNTSGNAACASTPLLLVAQGEDIFLTVGGDDAACQTLPLSIRILKAPVSAALLEIMPIASGTASYTYYGDLTGTQVIYQSPVADVSVGELATLMPGDGAARQIRRIDVAVGNQAIQLTRLLLSAPNP